VILVIFNNCLLKKKRNAKFYIQKYLCNLFFVSKEGKNWVMTIILANAFSIQTLINLFFVFFLDSIQSL
jgi:hypothetical protein